MVWFSLNVVVFFKFSMWDGRCVEFSRVGNFIFRYCYIGSSVRVLVFILVF